MGSPRIMSPYRPRLSGVGDAKHSELLEITDDQNKVYYEENCESLQNLEKEILYEVCSPQGCNMDCL